MLLALLAFGALARNTWSHRRTLALDFGLLGTLFALTLFAVSGALLEFSGDARLWAMAAALIVARQLGKTLATAAFALPSGVSLRKGVLTGLGLAPMSALAIVMVHDTTARYPQLDAMPGALVLAAVVLMQLVGPVLTQRALIEAGEDRPEEPR
jgi:Kef-type K+ transport system membrane component KefB